MVDSKSSPFSAGIKRWLTIGAWVVFCALVLIASLYKLNDYPTLWWDEGWTLSAARNWIENGHLGNILDGQLVPPRIPLRFPIAVPVTISMKLLGIGVWQGRLPGIIFTMAMLSLFVFITRKIYTRRTGTAALIILVLLSPYMFNPIISGRQVMAEMPMMFYLLAGYSLVWLAMTRNKLWGIGSVILFGIASHAKLQVPPFWILSMGLAIWQALISGRKDLAKLVTWITVGSLVCAVIVYLIQNSVMLGSFADTELLLLLLNTSIISLTWSIRERAFFVTIIFAFTTVFAYIWSGKRILVSLFTRRKEGMSQQQPSLIHQQIMRAALWGLGASWLLWFVTMSSYWVRYLMPAYIVGVIFMAAFVGEHTDDFNLKTVFPKTARLLFRLEFKKTNFIALTIILLFSLTIGLMLGTFRSLFPATHWQPEIAAEYIRDNIPTNARIETFESELLFLAPQQKYHVPPDVVSMQLYRRADIDLQTPIEYDALKAKPEYLVVGPFAQSYGLYSPRMIADWFTLVKDIGGYQIYRINKTQ